MSGDEQRKNPRFLAADGIPAEISAAGKSLPGAIQNFSASGFAIVVIGDPGLADGTTLQATLSPGAGKPLLTLQATIANQSPQGDGKHRLGCLIGDLGDQANAYFAFLTSLVTKQGLIMSMAKKPLKYREPGSE